MTTANNHRLLVIANYSYEDRIQYPYLSNVANEICFLNDTFVNLDYNVTILINYNYDNLCKEITAFLKSVTENDTIIIYYTGHGFHYKGHNFIICTDSSSNANNSQGDPTFYEELYKVYDMQRFLNYLYPTKNVLFVANACRTIHYNLSDSVPPTDLNSTGTIAQFYSASVTQYSYDNSCFYECFGKSCVRYGHNLTEIFESINEGMHKKMRLSERQQPICIHGCSDFCIADKKNEYVEKNLYADLITIYKEYLYEENLNDVDNAEDLYNKKNEMADIYYPKARLIKLLNSFIRNTNYGFIGVFQSIPCERIRILKTKFGVKGNYWHWFDNENLYDYNELENKIIANSKVDEYIRNVRILSNNIYYIHFDNITISGISEGDNNSCFDLRFNTPSINNITSYTSNTQSLKIMMQSACRIMISARIGTNKMGFLNALLDNYVQYSENLLFLHSKERLSSAFTLDYKDISSLSNQTIRNSIKLNIANNYYDRIIMSLSIVNNPSNLLINAINEIVLSAINSKTQIIFLTEIMPNHLKNYPLTKRVYNYIDYAINLDIGPSNSTYISKIGPCI